ncbi:carbamate kinase [Nitrososphaera sp.]|uniref:carbamate kinase n=1 Tax=Nitrososphaera sp. TaxID=1971748 RepID=UPI0017C9B97A|nr:carbamate kinase [Nitrososphaera sp.]NWG37337.1 carbamate kinase [Nitrososphaera sp.]
MPDRIAVIALGGNAITTASRTFSSQYEAVRAAARGIANLAKKYRLVVTHGNGPQVGDALLRNERAAHLVPPLPLHACVAETQGMLGAMIQAALSERLGRDAKIASLVTKVEVSTKDPALGNPSKPVGPTYAKRDLEALGTFPFREVSPGKYRRVVPSPDPVSVLEAGAVKKLVDSDFIVIACGGGGVPVTGDMSFVDAVIDKDLASERLATAIGASLFVSLTDVEGVYMDFWGRRRLLKKASADEMKKLLAAGEFEEGSMEPKVRAAVRFAENTGGKAVIASLRKTAQAASLQSGTVIYR